MVGFSLLYCTPQAPLINTSLINAYILYIYNLFQGDFGVSGVNSQLIIEQLKEVFPATMELCILAFILALIIGIPLGVIAGLLKGKWQDGAISALALLGCSMPVFWLAILLILFFSIHLGLFPVSGRYYLLYPIKNITGFSLIDACLSDSPYRDEMFINVIHHMILPVISLAMVPMTEMIRLIRISVYNVAKQNYIKAATMRGLTQFTIIRRHVLHNALPPIIPKLGLQFSTMLTIAMITEVVFNWPGLGRWMINAIRQQDFTAISVGVMLVGSLVLIVNLMSEIICTFNNILKHRE